MNINELEIVNREAGNRQVANCTIIDARDGLVVVAAVTERDGEGRIALAASEGPLPAVAAALDRRDFAQLIRALARAGAVHGWYVDPTS